MAQVVIEFHLLPLQTTHTHIQTDRKIHDGLCSEKIKIVHDAIHYYTEKIENKSESKRRNQNQKSMSAVPRGPEAIVVGEHVKPVVVGTPCAKPVAGAG